MKLKYYLRGLGIGIVVTTVILAISFAGKQKTLSDTEIIARAKELGMVMPENETENIDAQKLLDEAGADKAGADVPPETSMDEAGADVPPETSIDEAGADVPPETSIDDTEPLPPEEGGLEKSYFLTIQPGDVCRVVCEDLEKNGIISDSEALRKHLSEIGYANNMSIGIYKIPYGLTMEEVAQVLKAGPIEE